MFDKKNISKASDALGEIKKVFNDNFKDGLQLEDFDKPFAALIKNGEVIYKTYNPLENGVYVGDEKLKVDWDVDPMETDFKLDITQEFKEDIKLVFSLDGNVINALESKPGESGITGKLQLNVKF